MIYTLEYYYHAYYIFAQEFLPYELTYELKTAYDSELYSIRCRLLKIEFDDKTICNRFLFLSLFD